MDGISPLQHIREFIDGFIAQWNTIFVVDIKISPANDIKVFLDADDGITIEKCTAVNRALYKHIEESGLFPDGNFSLEVSSPGVEEPLKLHRQYKKNIGRKVEVLNNDGSKLEGKLVTVTDRELTIESKTGKSNKAITTITTVLFDQIKHTKVLITF